MEQVTAPVSATEPVDPADYAAAADRARHPSSPPTTTTLQAVLAEASNAGRCSCTRSSARIVERSYSGPARVSGGPGTGKTIVALHRVKWLVHGCRPVPVSTILFTTFNKNLATDLQQRLVLLGGPELLERVEVVNIDRLAAQVVTEAQPGRGRTGWMTTRPSTCGVNCCSSWARPAGTPSS